MTEWIFVLNKLSFGSAAYPDFVCLRRDTVLQKIKNDYLAKKWRGGGYSPPAPLVALPLVDQGSEFYNKSLKDFLKINKIEMYSTYNEGKSVVAERFIRTLKNKILKQMTAISKNVSFDVLDDIKYNNTVHRTIKMKPIEVTDDDYAEYNEIRNKNNPKFKVGDNVRISKQKNIFAEEYTPSW